MALGYLHDRNIVHRDIKSENIIVQENGYIKLIDYGLSRKIQEDELTMSFCGTADYLAPETIRKLGSDKAIDWWALGILMYELIIGKSPFYHKDVQCMYINIKTKYLSFPDPTDEKAKNQFTPEFQDIVTKLLAFY